MIRPVTTSGVADRLLLILIAAAVSMYTAGAAQSDPVEPSAGAAASENVPHQGSATVFAVGDRLKITMFESLRLESGRTNTLSTLIERPELSGDYVIQSDGRVFLPFIGDVDVAGRTQATLTRAVEASYSTLLGGPVRLTVRILEREPIYVTGPVPRPGVFKYTPGMTILHAIALAGGVDATATDQWSRFELSRERERILKSRERLLTLLAFRDVLAAERDATVPAPSQQLIELAGEPGASQLVIREEQLRAIELQKNANEAASIASIDEATRNELIALRDRTAQLEAHLKSKSDYVRTLSNMRTSGVVTEANFHLAQSELNNVRERWHEVRSTIAQLERRLLELHHQKIRNEFDERLKREQQIKTVHGLIIEEQITQATIGALSVGPVDVSSPKDFAKTGPRYKVIRRTATGLEQLDSDRLSLSEALWPGDVLLVERDSARSAGAVAHADDRLPSQRIDGRRVE
ncbi:polysaccharide biosynthesis/export family protein [Pseudorhodoplanes sp.]|uniref:polysaccharide biosynthesis/export family protein n=1 Tax=Pseudorhodoplanes sp. TaxID=1934341 RepID=UPI00391C743C